MPDDILFLFGLFTTASIILIGHWIPWPRRLPRILAYTYGISSILAGLAVWLLLSNQRDLWLHICLFMLCAGVATIASYAYDTWRNHEIQQRINKRYSRERRQQ